MQWDCEGAVLGTLWLGVGPSTVRDGDTLCDREAIKELRESVVMRKLLQEMLSLVQSRGLCSHEE